MTQHASKDAKIKSIGCTSCDQEEVHKKCFPEKRKSKKGVHREAKKCAYCDIETDSDKSMRVHLKNSHPDKSLYKCNKCEYKSNWFGNMKVHKASLHEEIVYSCDKCEYKNKWRPPFLEHKREMHGEFVRNSKHCQDRVFKQILCDVCGYKAKSVNSLRNHKNSNHQVVFTCNHCGHLLPSANSLRGHIWAKHKNKKCLPFPF